VIGLMAAGALAFGSGCAGELCNGAALGSYLAKLDKARGRTGPPVHIMQIGDSHTAGDAITGAWRAALQGRYGSGGRGVLPPGRPYDGYTTRGVQVTMSPGWQVAADFGASRRDPSPPLGLSAFSLTSTADGASMALQADGGQAFDRLVVCAIARPGAGALTIRIGAEAVRWMLGSSSERALCHTETVTQPVTAAEVAAEGQVTITSWATFRDAGGVALSNLGVVGSQLIHFARTDDAVLTEELRAYKPDLLVIAFGTNEGFAPRFNSFEYETILRTQVARLRRLAGNVPILLMGAPDALTRRAELRTNAGGAAAVPCGAPAPAPVAVPAPSSAFADVVRRIRENLGLAPDAPVQVMQPVASAPAAPAPGLFPPAALAAVRDAQRRVARSLNLAFWDWEARQGGRCTALSWTRANPALMRGDYVHYTSAGGREIAARLQADIDAAAKQ
jgi:lysophospholipase L1-like esterase